MIQPAVTTDPATRRVLADVADERIHQDLKWGQQNHPLIDQLLVQQNRPHTRFAEEYEIPTAFRATQLCRTAGERGQDDWLRILVEEVSEFMAAAEDAHRGPASTAAARAELVQVAAVAVAAIECIDRSTAAPALNGETLHTRATDRYRVAWSQWTPGDIDDDQAVQDQLGVDWGSGDEPWSATIALDEAVELVKVFKLPAKEMQTPVTVDYDAERRTVKVRRDRDTGHSAITIVAVNTFVEAPDIPMMLAKSDRIKAARNATFNAKWLADFAKVRARGPMRLTFTPSLFVHITIGKRFIGAIVQVRDDEDLRSLLPESEPAEA